MKKIITLSFAALLLCFTLKAQEVFENEYFKISLPEGMTRQPLPTDPNTKSERTHRYKSGTNSFIIREIETKLSAGRVIGDMEDAFKQLGETVQSRPFNVNGYIMPGLIEIEKDAGNTYAHLYIMFDNGRHKVEEAGNAFVFQFEMVYRIEDEMQQQPKNEKALQTLTHKMASYDISYDLGRSTEFSVTAAASSFLYYTITTPILMSPAGLSIYFSEIKQGAYGTDPNPPFADLLKTEFKEFKKLNPKNAVLEEMTIDGYKAALLKGSTEDKKKDYCRTKFRYLIEVSPKLIRTVSYEMSCEYEPIQQPVIEAIVKSFKEHKNKK
ncbi:MAG: hypothetical protein POELPBGB_02059 [Bacteroidia bacterium]|nr:hypothetical protein [Bacteroidia bacterium]